MHGVAIFHIVPANIFAEKEEAPNLRACLNKQGVLNIST
jgi:hypothetical protein